MPADRRSQTIVMHRTTLLKTILFLGIHFDFHASDDCKEIGRNTTREIEDS